MGSTRPSWCVALTFPASSFVPVVRGFFGLGTGYLIDGPQELLGFPRRDPKVDGANGVWGPWMACFCQFLVGVYLFVGLTWFPVFTANKALYMAALAFSAYASTGSRWAGAVSRAPTPDPTASCRSPSSSSRSWA